MSRDRLSFISRERLLLTVDRRRIGGCGSSDGRRS
jgi:hypothetical protein